MSGAQRSACVARDDLADLLDPGLRGARLEALQAHIEECVVCRREVRDLAAAFARLRVEGDASGTQVRSSARMPAASVAPPAPPSAGSELAHYELGREIARGGMGRIVEAWDLRHQRPVALKMLLRNGASAMRRFAREVEITAHLQHPAIIPLYEAGRCPTGEPFFAMKRVEGRPLSEVITRTHDLRSRVALLPQLIAVSEALAYAHEQGIVHRDLKPANVLIGAFGEAVVIDWGLAKAIDASESVREIPVELPAGAEPLTVAGAAMGTPGYMPPEQARGAPVDERSDVYALGALLYHVFSGVPPYSGPSPSGVIERVLQEPPRPLREAVPELAPDLAAIVDKAMARDPAQRYPDAGELARDLRRFEAGQLVTARSYTQPELVRRWLARRRAVVTTAAVLVIALLATATLSFRRIVRERDCADAARQAAVTQRDAAEKVVGFVIGDSPDAARAARAPGRAEQRGRQGRGLLPRDLEPGRDGPGGARASRRRARDALRRRRSEARFGRSALDVPGRRRPAAARPVARSRRPRGQGAAGREPDPARSRGVGARDLRLCRHVVRRGA